MISIPISVGELLDKLSILHIKKDKIQDSDKVKKVKIEYELLYTISEPFLGIKEFFNLYDDLIPPAIKNESRYLSLASSYFLFL